MAQYSWMENLPLNLTILKPLTSNAFKKMNSVHGSVGRPVAYGIKCPQFKSGHRQKTFTELVLLLTVTKTEIKKKRPGIAEA